MTSLHTVDSILRKLAAKLESRLWEELAYVKVLRIFEVLPPHLSTAIIYVTTIHTRQTERSISTGALTVAGSLVPTLPPRCSAFASPSRLDVVFILYPSRLGCSKNQPLPDPSVANLFVASNVVNVMHCLIVVYERQRSSWSNCD